MSTPGDLLLDHYDRIAKSEAAYTPVSDPGGPKISVATYQGFPDSDSIIGFTFGLSHFHPPGGGHRELLICMRDDDMLWSCACGYTAFQLHDRSAFNHGDTVNFSAEITTNTKMSSFAAVHPLHIAEEDCRVDIGIREVELMQLIPLYEAERQWISDTGDVEAFLDSFSKAELMDPRRRVFQAGGGSRRKKK